MHPFATLNPEQRAAAGHGLDAGGRLGPTPPGPLLVLAGAGSGKTTTLAARVAQLVLAGADPGRILLLTFSRRAAQAMQRRVGLMLHQALDWPSTRAAPRLPWAGTFHSIGARLLRELAPRIGLSETCTIQDRGDSEDLLGLVRQELGLGTTHRRFPQKATCLAIYSRVVNTEQPLEAVLEQTFPWCREWADELKGMFRAYAAEKTAQQVLDYDDLLLWWAEAMRASPAIAASLGARFEHVLVDEFQDTNRLQAAILHALKPDGRGLTVVGDDAQSIYSFRAAEVRNILDFPARFDPPARTVLLERNYRSTRPILDAANRVIGLATEGLPKRLWSDRPGSHRPSLVTVDDEAAQAAWVADQVLRHREDGIALKGQAVLFRTAHHAAPLELELARRGIPFVKFGGLKFLEARHVKDVLAILRWSQNLRHRMAGVRVAQLVDGIGIAQARRLADAIAASDDPDAMLRAFRPPRTAREGWSTWLDVLAALRRPEEPWPAALDRAVAWYLPQLERLCDDAAIRAGDLRQLQRLAAGFGSRERFLAETTLDPPEATSDEAGPPLVDEDYLILSTIHSAKGQEWRSVFLLNVVDGCMPSDLATGRAAEIEEERRLLYVAMTRARQHLHLVAPLRFHVSQQSASGDRHLYGGVTRFLPTSIRDAFDAVSPAHERQGDEDDGLPRDASGRESHRLSSSGASVPVDVEAPDNSGEVPSGIAGTVLRRWM